VQGCDGIWGSGVGNDNCGISILSWL
jgi:hypothetical protein